MTVNQNDIQIIQEAIRPLLEGFITKNDLKEEVGQLATKEDIAQQTQEISKVIQQVVASADSHFATKKDLGKGLSEHERQYHSSHIH